MASGRVGPHPSALPVRGSSARLPGSPPPTGGALPDAQAGHPRPLWTQPPRPGAALPRLELRTARLSEKPGFPTRPAGRAVARRRRRPPSAGSSRHRPLHPISSPRRQTLGLREPAPNGERSRGTPREPSSNPAALRRNSPASRRGGAADRATRTDDRDPALPDTGRPRPRLPGSKHRGPQTDVVPRLRERSGDATPAARRATWHATVPAQRTYLCPRPVFPTRGEEPASAPPAGHTRGPSCRACRYGWGGGTPTPSWTRGAWSP